MKRYLYDDIFNLSLNRKKMAFISGPRQVGKTTLAKEYSKVFQDFIYKNWDESEFRRLWTKSPQKVFEEFPNLTRQRTRCLILDEIHKSKGWKQKIKGLYDLHGEELAILVTGSARLNVFRKGGDSLMGRFFHFRLHPLSLGELDSQSILDPESWKNGLFQFKSKVGSQEILERLFKRGGFPEPYFSESDKILRLWRRGRTEKIIREDLRDLSRIMELSQVEVLASLLPEKVGSPLSVQSLREDLEVSHDTVRRWLNYLEELYYHFEIRPWTKSVTRSLKKDPKIYLYDWSEVPEKGPRFENLLASHFLKACHYWTDTGEGYFDLHYLRNKEKQEIDFIISKDNKPWIAFESKFSDTHIDFKTAKKYQEALNCPVVQVLFEPDHFKKYDSSLLLLSAQRCLMGLP